MLEDILNYTLKEYIDEINSHFTKIEDGSLVNLDTGEIFSNSEFKDLVKRKLEIYNRVKLESMKKEENENGFEINQNIYNIDYIKDRKKRFNSRPKEKYDGGDFNMVYRDKLPKLNDMLNFSEKGVWYSLCELTGYPSNCVLINGEVPTFKEISDYVGMSERNLRRYIKTLEEKQLIKFCTVGFRKAMFINPEYYATGKELDLNTLKLFNLIELDEDKINDYI